MFVQLTILTCISDVYLLVMLVRLYVNFVQAGIVITSLGEAGAGQCAARPRVCSCFSALCFTFLPLESGGGLRNFIMALPGDICPGRCIGESCT